MDKDCVYEIDKESINKLEGRKWIRGLYTERKERIGSKLLLIDSY